LRIVYSPWLQVLAASAEEQVAACVLHRRLVRAAPPSLCFCNILRSYRDAAAAINSDRIRVLIDMDVWMKGRRPEILALRPAATQLTFLGYCGSSGAAWIDGAVMDRSSDGGACDRVCDCDAADADADAAADADADATTCRIVMPPEHAHIFSERLLLMPRTYQVNDYPGFYRRDVPTGFHVARREHALPERSTILANFNQLYKIDPSTLSLWAKVLHHCSSCVLWLLAFPHHAKDNMLKVRGCCVATDTRFCF
jgi:protein O-GlcNAc transferase